MANPLTRLQLATRSDEYHRLCQDTTSEWSKALCTTVPRLKQSIAEQVAQVLSPATGTARPGLEGYETLIHGDVKASSATYLLSIRRELIS